MFRNNDEKQVDNVLGEAVLALIRDAAPVSNSALIKQLQRMANAAGDAEKRQACQHAIREIEHNLALNQHRQRHEVLDRDNVTHIIVGDNRCADKKKH
ncbi:MAG: hypothetical protein XXXJIFNMEKO3_03172 [Candidatus Erwinia impunctatus]|nr:hypothetical protein XXXJIFNMEKO_03172 [Culicoides impunctatus]